MLRKTTVWDIQLFIYCLTQEQAVSDETLNLRKVDSVFRCVLLGSQRGFQNVVSLLLTEPLHHLLPGALSCRPSLRLHGC